MSGKSPCTPIRPCNPTCTSERSLGGRGCKGGREGGSKGGSERDLQVAGRERSLGGRGSEGAREEASETLRWLGVSGHWEGEGAREQGCKRARPSGD